MRNNNLSDLVKCPFNGCEGACPYWVNVNGYYYCWKEQRPHCVVDGDGYWEDEEEEES